MKGFLCFVDEHPPLLCSFNLLSRFEVLPIYFFSSLRLFKIYTKYKIGELKKIEVTIGFEPMNNGFADHSLKPLGYVTLFKLYERTGS